MRHLVRLYDHPISSNALKVRFLLAELGLDCERVHVPFAHPRPQELTALHPFGTIPFLVDGDLRLGESNAILRYLARREGRDDLYPAEPADCARVDWLLDTWSIHVRPALHRLEDAAIFFESGEIVGSVEDADAGAVAAQLGPAGEALDRYERLVSDNGTVAGRFTIAECCVGPVLWRTARLPLEFERWPRLARIRDAIGGRDSFRRAEPVA
jgi:glutathione S-transferase